MLSNSGPPRDVEPEDLFLEQLEAHPEMAIGHRLAAAPDVALSVRSVPGWRVLRFVRASDHLGLVAAALRANGEPVATGPLGLLTPTEFLGLSRAVGAALDRICPTYGLSDVDAWFRVMETGASRCASAVHAMARCRDVAIGWSGAVHSPRPDRFWGRPLVELYDGQLMAFRGAMKFLDRHT